MRHPNCACLRSCSLLFPPRLVPASKGAAGPVDDGMMIPPCYPRRRQRKPANADPFGLTTSVRCTSFSFVGRCIRAKLPGWWCCQVANPVGSSCQLQHHPCRDQLAGNCTPVSSRLPMTAGPHRWRHCNRVGHDVRAAQGQGFVLPAYTGRHRFRRGSTWRRQAVESRWRNGPAPH